MLQNNVAPSMTTLQNRWTSIYQTTLPALAKCRSPVQTSWPVVLDHCFARIILDNAVGIDTPWADKVKAPAIKNMSEMQLEAAIDLGEAIASGQRSLTELDERSLALRGKKAKGTRKRKAVDAQGELGPLEEQEAVSPLKKKSRKGEMADIWSAWSMKREVPSEGLTTTGLPNPNISPASPRRKTQDDDALDAIRARITSDPALTPFRAHVLTLLTQVPRGRYTTYKALAEAVPHTCRPASASATSVPQPTSTTCARAIGSAMRNNPFAPTVPCHRVLAANGSIGGFGGDWGDTGRFVQEKRRLLREEGVRFDGRGKVVGSPFVDFV